ncbi:hypothetical protein ACQP2F_03115 [Actinoplanes sp. CA-030573]|uniref:hypothetical protein n=1 Tax=Actinoplanes sp. CA-030573 TaxID=3239898 RepID=UPI003D94E05C
MTTLLAPAPVLAPDRASDDTARDRLIISAASLFALFVGVVGLVSGVDWMRATGFVAYFMFGIGAAPFALLPRIGLPLRLALSTGASISILVIVSTVMLDAGWWQPTLATWIVGAVTAGLHVAGCASAISRRSLPRESRSISGPLLPKIGTGELMAGTGAILCLVAAMMNRHLDPGLWGFLVRIGPLWYIGLALIVLSLAIYRAYGIGVVLLLIVLTGTPALLYDLPRIQSAAKHVELVEQIRQQHVLQSTVDVYNGWPGFFSGMAWLAQAAGIRDSINLAIVWPVLIGLYRIAAMRFFAGQLIKDRNLAWLAVLFVLLPDTIGQDYFSPQSVGFALGILIFGFALSSLPLRYKIPAIAVPAVTVAITHQLSPYIIGGALCVLVVLRAIKPWWLPGIVLGAAVLWAAINWADLSKFVDLKDLGRTGNLAPPTPGSTSGLGKLPVFLATEAGLALSLMILGVLSLVTLWRRRRSLSTWALACAPGAGVAIIVAHPYGKEGIFRATLFALPWLAVLAAQAFPFRLAWSRGLIIAVLTADFLIGTFSLDASNVMRRADREGFQMYAQTATAGAVNYCLIIGPGDLPSGPITGPDDHISLYRGDIDTDYGFTINQAPTQSDVERLTGELVTYSGSTDPTSRLYAFWSPTSSYYGWEYGLHLPSRFAALRDAFAASPLWKTVYSSDGTVMFEYTGA